MNEDTLRALGKIASPQAGRDAVHIAVAPVVATHTLEPGQHVGLTPGGASADAEHIGVVDPFLTTGVYAGQKFWLFLYPGTITSLRHEWTHPAFGATSAEPSASSASERWIRDFADSIPLHYDTIMEGARDYLADVRKGGYGEYLCFGGLLEGHSVPDEFWSHYENVAGEAVEEGHRGSFFTCSC